jgi:hypothetical protein
VTAFFLENGNNSSSKNLPFLAENVLSEAAMLAGCIKE